MAKQRKTAKSTAPELPWRASQLSRNVVEIKISFRQAKDWEFWFLLQSDHHWDSKKCNRQLLKSHLDLAVERRAAALFTGDLYDIMGGKYDKRASKSDLRPEFKTDNYLDEVVNASVDWFEPYAHNIVCVGEGNHETAIKSRWETDMIQRFVALMNARSKASIYAGGYAGWLRFAFTQQRNNGSIPIIQTVNLRWDHGWGGGGQVTHDAIQHQRRSTYLPDAHIITSGHSHDFWSKDIARHRLSKSGNTYDDSVLHIKCPSYKSDYGDGHSGWCIERGHAPKVLGGWFIRFSWCGRRESVVYEAIAAK